METKAISKEEAIKKGYLQNKKVFLKPIPRAGKMITESSHMGYFMWEGATLHVALPQGERGDLINPFNSDEEKKFFEKELDLDLNIHKKKDNFWHNFYVKVKKDAMMMEDGVEYDLKDPKDNLRYRVLLKQDFVCTEWDKRFTKGHYRFVLVDEYHDVEEANSIIATQEQAWVFFGSIMHSPKKMKDFLSVYLLEKRSSKEVPFDSSKEWLKKEIKTIMDEDMITFLSLSNDNNLELKQFVANAVKVGSIQKEGINTYVIPGETVKYSFPEMVKYVKILKDRTDDAYIKMEIQIKEG